MFTLVPYRRYLSRPASPFESMLKEPFFRSFFNGNDTLLNDTFRVDIRESDNAYTIEAEVPGLNEDQIKLEVDNNVLTISAEFNTEKSEEDNGRTYTERRSGHMERSFNLDGIDENNIAANCKNGILYVTLPKEKPVEKTARRIPVLSEGQPSNENE
ncbi:MAG: Hsp20/alpha crystallin family protein [Bacillota bacterium]|nr:Hsp20/alpha crystallin family protein [Bacillota bacterium]